MTSASLPVFACALTLLAAPTAQAQTSEGSGAGSLSPDTSPSHSAPTPPTPPTPPAAPDAVRADASPVSNTDSPSDLRIAFSPYIWLTGFSGDVGVRSINMNINKNFFEILDESDSVFGLMGALDLDYQRFVFQYQGSWVTSEFSHQVGSFDTGSVNAELDLEALWNEVFVGVRLLETPPASGEEERCRVALDAFCGGRFTAIDADATLTATSQIVLPDGGVVAPGASVGRDRSESWFEPFIGMRAVFELDEHWVIQLRGDVGGFGVDGSDFSWQAIGVVGYQWRNDGWDIGLFAGYRALGQDYANGDFHWDMITHGPAIGGSIRLHF